VVDKAVLAKKLAAIRDAVARGTRDRSPEFVRRLAGIDRPCDAPADQGWDVPQNYGDAFTALADRDVLERELAQRLRAASGLRNLIAHQYGAIDAGRIFELASNDIEDLLSFCRQVAQKAEGGWRRTARGLQ
jgi:hypothetical protein